MPARAEIAGQKFGKLTALEPAYSKGGRWFWKCQCDCGNICYVESYRLKTGHTKSCGCIRRNKSREKWIDLTGCRFGRLLVLELIVRGEHRIRRPGREDGHFTQKEFWKCQCDCGNICVCTKDTLCSGSTQSCGCIRNEQRKLNMKKAIHFVDGTCVERIACRRTVSNNTSGHRGVYKRKNGTWRASIGFKGITHDLGTFPTFEEAVQARVEAEKRLYDPFIEEFHRRKMETENAEGYD